jgi:BirA family transcriptional regulator, biotin operon repressor / biotin---[acetyl-CoA-carboxylase] ligase
LDSFNNTLFIGKFFLKVASTASTNELAQELVIKNNAKNGMVVIADDQTSGKGQFGRKWISKPGQNILLSIILFPKHLPATGQFYLNMAISTGTCKFVENIIGNKTRIKWPNDIYYYNSKIAGILIENTLEGKNIQSVVAGIGININQTDFPDEIPNPGSLKLITGKDYRIMELIEKLCVQIEQQILLLNTFQYKVLSENYLQRLYKLNVPARYKAGGRVFTATITGVSKEGRLQLLNENGVQEEFNFKEVEFIL